MITICCTYFQSLALANLRAALYSVRQQDLSRVRELILVDNNTTDSIEAIQEVLDDLNFQIPVHLRSSKHGDPSKTHSWSTNAAVRTAMTEWLLFTRADYLLRFDLLKRCLEFIDARPAGWNGFVTGHGYHLNVDIGICELSTWRTWGPDVLQDYSGVEFDYTSIDAGVWMARRDAFERVGGLDETLTAWGHAQTHFQYKLHAAGVEFVRIPQVLFYHPAHAAPRDIRLANEQLQQRGVNLKDLWARYEGQPVY